MKNLNASYFFDLSKFQHTTLFDPQDFVWKALEKLESYLTSLPLGLIESEIPHGAFLIDAHLISIEKGCVIEPGAYIKGPCYIGANSTIRHGAYIRGNVITGEKCVIGHDTEIKNAILFNNTQAAHFAYVGDSILGNHVNLGAGTKCANLRFDHQPIIIHCETQRIKTGLRKLGAVIGDESQIGCNVVTNPGTLIGQQTWCLPNLNIAGLIPSYSYVKGNNELSIISRPPANFKSERN